MFVERFDELSDLIFRQMFLDESEEMFFDLIAVLVLDFVEGEELDVVFLKIVNHGGFAVEELAGDCRRINDFFDRRLPLADVILDHFGVFRNEEPLDR